VAIAPNYTTRVNKSEPLAFSGRGADVHSNGHGTNEKAVADEFDEIFREHYQLVLAEVEVETAGAGHGRSTILRYRKLSKSNSALC
jgi:hypothetical protein